MSTDELNRQATEHIHIPVIELDEFRRVKRRRMRTFGRKPRWGRGAILHDGNLLLLYLPYWQWLC
ncbi:hypothetical protein P9222_08780 [Paenibacillus amylolyticus]|nr:hypothetical protein [Paenibacillus amylolyticus]WFR64247.1 hypothetical protein P9222_08780 [Paenibacillus amylolyticus]